MSFQTDVDAALSTLQTATAALTPELPPLAIATGVLAVLKAAFDALETALNAPAQPSVPEATLVHQATDALETKLETPVHAK